ncbi:50S ribosomal protein L1-like [Paramacrobiotus metropolitanus]|uniref:50S ribosomal protein L1-like n=1 Tax=Paramacrobiotus metropolitanus TaxID=2943436 RepID=UPI0024459335|nr:50S ribosomal protein L1-like [Paramacrobiotus metropolitanus]
MLQSALAALRQQVWPTYAGGACYQLAVRTAKRKHLRIAARRKREMENKLKAKEKIIEKTFVPYKIRLLQQNAPKVRYDELLAQQFPFTPTDNVWFQKSYMKRVCSLDEALQFHREACHPTVLNIPEAPLLLDVELNMKTDKEKFLDTVQGLVMLPHTEDTRVRRSVIAFCKNIEDQHKALEAGADIAGGEELVTKIEKGEVKVDNIAYAVSHVDTIVDVLRLRGILKKALPEKKRGMVGTDMATMTRTFATGIQYDSFKVRGELWWAHVKFPIGKVNMPDQHVKENLEVFLKSVTILKPADLGFILKGVLRAEGSTEEFVIDLQPYIPKVEKVKKGKKGKTDEVKFVEPATNVADGDAQERQAVQA